MPPVVRGAAGVGEAIDALKDHNLEMSRLPAWSE
jgi:hypothetical protein